MTKPACPCCNKDVQTRHTHMANLPATIVCTGCGAWMQIDVKNTGSLLLAAVFLVTLGVAWFIPAVLILLPVYLVLSTGTMERFAVTLSEKRPTKVWTINRDTGAIEKLGAKKDPVTTQEFEENLSGTIGTKLNRLRPFVGKASGVHRAPDQTRSGIKDITDSVPLVSAETGNGLPRGLPH